MRHFRSGLESLTSLGSESLHLHRHGHRGPGLLLTATTPTGTAANMSEDTLIAPLRVDLLQASALEDLSTRVMEEMDLGTLGASGFNLNESGFNPAPKFNEMSLIKTVVLSLMFVISMIGNSATLVQMYRMRRRRSTINTLIMHLATADLIVTFFCNVTDAVWASTVQWYAGNSLCKLVKFLQVFGLYLSTYIIVIISVDRCYAILDPMSRNNAAKRVRILIGVAWSLSALFSLPQSYIFRVARGPFQEEFYQCVTYGAYSAVWQEKLYSTLSVIVMFVIPLATMVTAYMLIFCTIAKKSRDLQKDQRRCCGCFKTKKPIPSESTETETTRDMLSRGPMRGQLFQKAKVKSLQMTAVIVAAFIICWTPYYVVFIVFTFSNPSDINERSSMWIFFFGMANSMVNPLIYGAFHVCKRRKSQSPVQYPRPVARTTYTTKTSSSNRSSRSTGVGGQAPTKASAGVGSMDPWMKNCSTPFIPKRQSIVTM